MQAGYSDSDYMRDAKWTQNADEVVGEEAEMTDSFKRLGKSMSCANGVLPHVFRGRRCL